MSRGRRAALVATALGLAAAGALAALAGFASAHADRLLAAVSRELGREVRAERVGISLWGGLGVALDDVSIADAPGDDAPLLAARRFVLRLRLLPLLVRRLVVDRVVIDGPVLNLVHAADGRLNVASLGRAPAPGAAPGPARGAGKGAPGPSVALALVRLRDGTLRYRDAASGRTLALTDVTLDAYEPRWAGPMPIRLQARLDGEGLRLEHIASEGTLDPAGARASYRGTLRAGPGALGTVEIARLAAGVEVRPPVLALDAVVVELLGGTLRGHGRVASGGDGAGLSVALDGSALDLAALPTDPKRPRPGGRLSFQAELAGPAPGSPGFRRALTGTGRFVVDDGRVAGLALGSTLRDVLAPLLGADAAARLRDHYPDLFGGDELLFTRLSGSGHLGGGRITTDDLQLAGPSYEAHGTGSLGLDGSLDLGLRLAATPALTDELLGGTKARAVLVDARGQLVVPLRVHGSLHHPKVSPEPEFTATAARALLAGTGFEDAAGSFLERLLGPRRKGAR